MNQPRIVIVDYDVGNIFSVTNAIRALGYKKIMVSADESAIMQAHALILPGVGAFAECMHNLQQRHLDRILHNAVMVEKKPLLGICVGMQMLCESSEEKGLHQGLGWIPGHIVRLKPPDNLVVPHVGWNTVRHNHSPALFARTPTAPSYYFDHSYHYQGPEQFIAAQCDYGMPVSAAICHNNIYGVQFHPEKSHNNGLRLFRSFFNQVSPC
jgi:imidazole glycerol-phosphate synthase subunit HisH